MPPPNPAKRASVTSVWADVLRHALSAPGRSHRRSSLKVTIIKWYSRMADDLDWRHNVFLSADCFDIAKEVLQAADMMSEDVKKRMAAGDDQAVSRVRAGWRAMACACVCSQLLCDMHMRWHAAHAVLCCLRWRRSCPLRQIRSTR